CGFDWSITSEEAMGLVADSPRRFSTAAELCQESVNAALTGHVVLNHATVGRMTTADVIRAASHDAHHHMWDVERIVEYSKA
ncbi:MAG: hypothetical protein Q8L05_05510, partial [Actinomycetota bacterium]|nr:hypothetical protein [Actinomycetota bacterium]